MGTSHPLAYAGKRHEQFLSELKEFIGFPSVSAQPKHAQDVRNCAAWLAAHLQQIGLQNVRIIPTELHPIVYAEWTSVRTCANSLSFGHPRCRGRTNSVNHGE